MRFFNFKRELNEFLVFSLKDIRKIEPDFDRRRLSEWQEKGYIQKVRRGFYVFADRQKDELSLFAIANQIYKPSYISFESALSYYHLIPESVYAVTSAATKKTSAFTSQISTFMYHKMSARLFFAYALVPYQNYQVKVAEPEKALLDYLYIRPELKSPDDFLELRLNEDSLREYCRLDKLDLYTRAFRNIVLDRRVKFLRQAYRL